jgi:hypothetical protein
MGSVQLKRTIYKYSACNKQLCYNGALSSSTSTVHQCTKQ